MHKHTKITHDRIKQFIDFDLKERLVTEKRPLGTRFLQGRFDDEQAARKAKGWQTVEEGFRWGPAYEHGWYEVTGTVPAEWQNESLALMYGKGEIAWTNWEMVEGTVWSQNSHVGGINGGHLYFRLEPGTTTVDLTVQTFAHNSETSLHRPEQPRRPDPELFRGFWLAVLDEDRFPLFYDCEFTFDLMNAHGEDDPVYQTLLRALNDVCNTFDETRRPTYARCRKIIKDALDSLNTELKHSITPVGHAHLDTAWLWPVDTTRLKMAHTTAVQLDLIDRYPEHVFAHSQASQYEWLEQERPRLFERVKAAAKKGQWEPVGSMWVEADCNLTGAESLVRQFLYGRRYFRKHFGRVTDDMFLPDVFGYSAALPQILEKFGIKYFLTQKMSWNQTNKIPHNTFWWRGIDGSRIWTHFPPADTYCANCSPKEIIESVKKHRDKGRSDHSLYLFGFGDGGGGPTEWHLERLRRARTAPGMPVVEKKAKIHSFYKTAYDESVDLETWHGELYFEYHRGTYTSQAANKRFNRQCEFLLRDVELLASFAHDLRSDYPSDEIEAAWKLVLLNQFHDIIPGSSVKEVYDVSKAEYEELVSDLTAMRERSLSLFADKLDTSEFDRPIAVFHNADLPTEASLPSDLTEGYQSLETRDGRAPIQTVRDENGERTIFATPTESLGAVAIVGLTDRPATTENRLKISGKRMENNEFSVRFDSNGNITSIQTLSDNPVEFVEPGKLANLFQTMHDRPLFWDAWDTEMYAQETVTDLVKSESFEIVERGPVRVGFELVKTFGKSTIRQRITLGPTPGIRFDTWVDWHEDHTFLKVAFPVNANAARASYEIQFGHVERPTHRNTSWDLARFEVCAQKWADVSEGGHGLALINTGKYGHDCHGSTLRLSLLRSPKAPDPVCDMGRHYFSYVLLPHYDNLKYSDVVAASYAVNAEPACVAVERHSGEASGLPAFVSLNTRDLVVESVKKAEDHAHRIVRLYEAHNSRGTAALTCAHPVKRAWLCDLDENRMHELEVDEGTVTVPYRPFEILTVMLES